MTDTKRGEITLIWSDVYFNWSLPDFGFGQMSFSSDRDTGTIECINEFISRERVREILHMFADHIADHCTLEQDEQKENPNV
jgi:hypothetical protein